MQEPDIVQRARAGDEAAFSALVRTHEALVRSLAGFYLDRRDAPDAAQEIWLAVHRKLWQLEDGDRFVPWLRKLVFYQCLNFRKARARRRAEVFVGQAQWQKLTEYVADDGTDLDALLAQRDMRRHINSQLQQLPGDYGLILKLYYIREWSVGQIAAQSELPVTTVKWRLHQGRRLLKARLAKALFGKERSREHDG